MIIDQSKITLPFSAEYFQYGRDHGHILWAFKKTPPITELKIFKSKDHTMC